MSSIRATNFRKVTAAGIGADPAFSANYEQQRTGLAGLSSPGKVKGIRTSGDNNAYWCQVQRRRIDALLESPELTAAEEDRGQARLQVLLDEGNLPALKKLHDDLKAAISNRAAKQAEREAARHEATKAALRPAA